MRSLLEFLGLSNADPTPDPSGDTETVRRIVAELDGMEPERARRIAAFAYLLGRVAHADLDISDEETRAMERLVVEVGGLPPEQAVLTVEIAKGQNRLFGGTESFRVSREYREITTKAERGRLLDCLFAVSAADEEISGPEEHEIRRIAEELGFSHREMVEIRQKYNHQRSVVRGLSDDG